MKKDHSWDGFFHLLVEGGGSGANNISYFYCGFSNSSDHKQDRHHEPCRTGVVGFAGVSDVGIGGGKGRIEGNTHYDAAHLAIAHAVACHAAAGLVEEIGIVKACLCDLPTASGTASAVLSSPLDLHLKYVRKMCCSLRLQTKLLC